MLHKGYEITLTSPDGNKAGYGKNSGTRVRSMIISTIVFGTEKDRVSVEFGVTKSIRYAVRRAKKIINGMVSYGRVLPGRNKGRKRVWRLYPAGRECHAGFQPADGRKVAVRGSDM